jgi:hypothetical protein
LIEALQQLAALGIVLKAGLVGGLGDVRATELEQGVAETQAGLGPGRVQDDGGLSIGGGFVELGERGIGGRSSDYN